jgi:anti-sigma28 factor (negative regulator of flagellin synthesis)
MPGKKAFEENKAQNAGSRDTEAKASVVVTKGTSADVSRAARIAELKAQIRSGKYRPNLEKVAERMLPDVRPGRN